MECLKMKKLSKDYLVECQHALAAEQAHSLSTTENWAHVDKALVHKDWDALYQNLAKHIDATPVDDANIQLFIKQHFDIACRFYTPSKEAYIGMALFYENNKDMKDFHNAYHPKMVSYLGNAMVLFAEQNL
jgi:hypothetical protein